MRDGEVDGDFDFIADEFIFNGTKESTVLVVHPEGLAIEGEGAAKIPALVSVAGEGDGKFHGLGDTANIDRADEETVGVMLEGE